MRIANVAGRAAILHGSPEVWTADMKITGFDVERASGGTFPADPARLLGDWERFRSWAERWTSSERPDVKARGVDLLAPSPRPSQVLAIGLNYGDHATETEMGAPASPPTFTKFPSCLSGPFTTVELPSDTVDWEVEIVATIGRTARLVDVSDAWSYVAGLSVGQDLSERTLQLMPPAPQFSLGKSFPGFGPFGPVLVTPDEFPDPDDIGLFTEIDGEQVQSGRTSQMIFSIPELVSRLSRIVTLSAGDIIFTGTPAGVGMARDPRVFLEPGQVVVSTAEVIGSLQTTLAVAMAPSSATDVKRPVRTTA